MKVGFIGFGKMGSALAQGAVAARTLRASDILIFDVDPLAMKSFARQGFKTAQGIVNLVESSNIVVLAVKPFHMKEVLQEVGRVSPQILKKRCFVSIAAGIPLPWIERKLGRNIQAVRVMPNTPALIREGMSVVSRGSSVGDKNFSFVKKIMSGVGLVKELPERKMDIVTAVSGSGPAYVFYLAEAMMEGAKAGGLSEEEATVLVNQTVAGAGRLLRESRYPAAVLRQQVTSKGGTTEAAVNIFEKGKLKPLVKAGIKQAMKRSHQLRPALD